MKIGKCSICIGETYKKLIKNEKRKTTKRNIQIISTYIKNKTNLHKKEKERLKNRIKELENVL